MAFLLLLVRLFSVYILYHSLVLIPYAISSVARSGGEFIQIAFLAIIVILFGCCLTCILFPKLALYRIDRPEERYADLTENVQCLQTVGVSLFGFFLLFTALREIVFSFNAYIVFLETRTEQMDASFWLSYQVRELVSNLLTLIVGILLMVGSGGVARFFIFLRTWRPRVEED